jgi:HK97 family phage portal protein
MAKRLPAPLRNLVLGWFGLDGSGDYTPAIGATSVGNVNVTNDSALRLAAVWACVRLISETIASLPLGIYQKTGTGKRYAPEHPLHFILHDSPNPDSTASVMWEAFVAAMLLPGNGLCEKLMIGKRLVGLRFLAPARLYITKVMPTGQKRYYYTYEDGIQREIPRERIFRVPGFTLDGSWGVSSIYYGANVLGSAQAAETAAGKTFEKGLMPTVALHYPEKVRESQREEVRATLESLSGAANAGRPIVLEGGMTATVLGINPADAQLLESRRYSREEICSWFRVPPWMVGYGEKSTAWGTGMEQQMIAFLQFVLAPWLRRIEQFIDKDLLSPQDRARGYYAKFSVEGLLRADSKSRAEFYDKMIKAAVMTPDQARELEEWDAMGGNASKLIVNAATVRLEDLGVQNAQTQAPAGRQAADAGE